MVDSSLPGDDIRNALARAAVDNAERLLRDASTLLAAGSAPTAHSLAVLALEEVGKAIICHRLGGDDERAQTRDQFLAEIRSHPAKLQRVRNLLDLLKAFSKMLELGSSYAMADSLEGYRAALIKQARDDHVRKLRGLYVDFSDTDEVRTPNEVTAGEAQEVLTIAYWAAEAARALLVEGTGLQITLSAENDED